VVALAPKNSRKENDNGILQHLLLQTNVFGNEFSKKLIFAQFIDERLRATLRIYPRIFKVDIHELAKDFLHNHVGITKLGHLLSVPVSHIQKSLQWSF
jgi:hypothetical protein